MPGTCFGKPASNQKRAKVRDLVLTKVVLASCFNPGLNQVINIDWYRFTLVHAMNYGRKHGVQSHRQLHMGLYVIWF